MFKNASPKDRLQGRLLFLAALFLAFYAGALTISPAVRARSWEVDLLWTHWLAWLAWALSFGLLHRRTALKLPDRDPFLLPIAAALSGWGLMTIWRLLPSFGARQVIWLLVAAGLFYIGLNLPSHLRFLRRYKYIWLFGGLLITSLSIFLGVNPLGYGPRLWLGCCGLFFQPSEPLKLLLIVYLAAYLADRVLFPASALRGDGSQRELLSAALLPLLAPTLIMTGLALLLLVVQRDLGTASIFIFLYTTIVYLASGNKRILAAGSGLLSIAGVAGYWLFDVVRLRVDAWLNPWQDPSGRSFQIVQSLLAVANGGVFGRGPGLGNPNFVPISHSDFIFSTIAEETGLVGAVALLLLVGLLASRGIRIALHAPDSFRRYLAAGLTAFLGGQSILIIGGNLRMLPLTGVTLPFVSYGGSSLVTSFLSLLILLHISHKPDERPAPLLNIRPYLNLGTLVLLGLALASAAAGWWGLFRSDELLARTDNLRRASSDLFVQRGAILDRRNSAISRSQGDPGAYNRRILYPPLSPVVGYTSTLYGQSGLEASLDDYLRGLRGNPGLTIWWNHLLYGQPPDGLNVRLALDLNLQRVADRGLEDHTGAVVLLNAKKGEILAMASHPTFDANGLEQNWDALVQDPESPLLNRATQGLYPPGAILGPLLHAKAGHLAEALPPESTALSLPEGELNCAVLTAPDSWAAVIANGCPTAAAALGKSLGAETLKEYFGNLGLYSPPGLRLPAAGAPAPDAIEDPAYAALGLAPAGVSASNQLSPQALRISPLQLALANAALLAQGNRPAPSIVQSVDIPQSGWVMMPPLESPRQVFSLREAANTVEALTVDSQSLWHTLSVAPNGPGEAVTWYSAGTSLDWEGTPLVVVVLLEEENPALAASIGRDVLRAAMLP